MNSRKLAFRGTIMLSLLGSLVAPSASMAQTMDQYYAVPPFVSDQVAPNIILVLDNSGSMSNLGNCDGTDDGDCVDLGSGDKPFTNTTNWAGYFDSYTCYTYDTTDTRFEPATVRATLAAACSRTQWGGNFLNWATFRPYGALKKSMCSGD